MKCSAYNPAIRAASLAAALLVPLIAAPESQIQTSATDKTTSAVSHVDFKIVIPKVLYLNVDEAQSPTAAATTVSIMSNNHDVMLTASIRASTDGSVPTIHGSVPTAHSSVPATNDSNSRLILTAPANRTITQVSVCAPRNVAASSQVICTASMP